MFKLRKLLSQRGSVIPEASLLSALVLLTALVGVREVGQNSKQSVEIAACYISVANASDPNGVPDKKGTENPSVATTRAQASTLCGGGTWGVAAGSPTPNPKPNGSGYQNQGIAKPGQ